MRISADEFDGAKLPRSYVGGYDVDATDDLLRRASEQLRQLLLTNAELSEEGLRGAQALADVVDDNAVLRAELEERHKREEVIGATLAASQRAAHEARENTRRECELMIKAARKQAENAVKDVERQRARLDEEIRELQEIRERTRDDFRELLTAALATLDGSPSNQGAGPTLLKVLLEQMETVAPHELVQAQPQSETFHASGTPTLGPGEQVRLKQPALGVMEASSDAGAEKWFWKVSPSEVGEVVGFDETANLAEVVFPHYLGKSETPLLARLFVDPAAIEAVEEPAPVT
jgi:hypothetical protein